MLNKRFISAFIASATLLNLTGCSGGSTSKVTAGQEVYQSSYKIKSVVTDAEGVSGTFEVFVDGDGNGEGLFGVQDIVYDVMLSNHEVYVKLEEGNYVYLFDASDKFTFDLDLPSIESISDMEEAGFVYSGGDVVSYSRHGDISISTKYQKTSNTFSPVTISKSNSMEIEDFLPYVINFSNEKIDQAEQIGTVLVEGQGKEDVPEETEEPEKESFYVNSDLAITINDKKFSVGDYVNPSTYFFNLVPEGMSTNYEYDQDKRIEVRYYSYLDTTGRVEFETVDGDVYGILAYCNAKFLKFENGMAQDDIVSLLGIKWNEKKQGPFKPIRSDIEIVSSKSNTYIFTTGGLTVELRCKNKVLNAIYVSKERRYREYNS